MYHIDRRLVIESNRNCIVTDFVILANIYVDIESYRYMYLWIFLLYNYILDTAFVKLLHILVLFYVFFFSVLNLHHIASRMHLSCQSTISYTFPFDVLHPQTIRIHPYMYWPR